MWRDDLDWCRVAERELDRHVGCRFGRARQRERGRGEHSTPPREIVVRSASVPFGSATAHQRCGRPATWASPTQSMSSAV